MNKMVKKALSYSESVKEIEEILHQLESGELDVDILAEKVKRATELINQCKKRLSSTEEQVNKILEENEDLKPGEDKDFI